MVYSPQNPANTTQILYYNPDVKNANYYSAYGATAKTFGSPSVLAFNQQRKSPEIGADAQTAMFWEYNGDVGRRFNVDPVKKSYESPYASFANNPIWFTDRDGNDTTLHKMYGGQKIANKKGGDKTAIFVVDETAKNYNQKKTMGYRQSIDLSSG